MELALSLALPGLDVHHPSVRTSARLYRCDMVWPAQGLIVEFDGSYWHRGFEGRDREKATHLRECGWRVVRAREEPLLPLHEDDVCVLDVQTHGVINAAETIGVHLRGLGFPAVTGKDWAEQAAKECKLRGRDYHALRNQRPVASPPPTSHWEQGTLWP
ncbi:DUF559 domain-containing protein [Nocardiopsis synnemataformans]|uniref:DUF559 domain-containing protein n=1 Tax=Nocardiopsis synnemataformans TaxID=61305 RepID=UPI003EB96F95